MGGGTKRVPLVYDRQTKLANKIVQSSESFASSLSQTLMLLRERQEVHRTLQQGTVLQDSREHMSKYILHTARARMAREQRKPLRSVPFQNEGTVRSKIMTKLTGLHDSLSPLGEN
jgi:hypothetical protein